MNEEYYSLNQENSMARIKPELVAAKLQAAVNLEIPELHQLFKQKPRVPELLWFLQARSMAPGGIQEFVKRLIEENPAEFGTPSFLDLIKAGKVNAAVDDFEQIWREIPEQYLDDIFKLEQLVEVSKLYDLKDIYGSEFDSYLLEIGTPFKGHLCALRLKDIQRGFQAVAAVHLADHLTAWSMEKTRRIAAPWYCPNLIDCLFRVMDQTAERASKTIAKTKVVEIVFDGMKYAWTQGVLVLIYGNSRFGKTESIKNWCARFPGRARVVPVPYSNSEGDLFRAVAEALGMEHTLSSRPQELRERIEYVLHYGRLMLVFDEAHFAIPTRFTKNTPPPRLNWIRTQIVDKRIPCVMVSTPQAYKQQLKAYADKSGYVIEQFLGRYGLKKVLPTELESSDLLKVAKVNFPEIPEAYLNLMVAQVLKAESFIAALECIARRARYLASEDGRERINSADCDKAASEVLPSVESVKKPAKREQPDMEPTPTAARKPSTSRRMERPLQSSCNGDESDVEESQDTFSRISPTDRFGNAQGLSLVRTEA